MKFTITKSFQFESAHWLPMVPVDHKCRNMHGHSYQLDVTVEGELSPEGWVMDFGKISSNLVPLIKQLDHKCLNDIIPNPTSENLCVWFYEKLSHMPSLKSIRVCESASTSATLTI